MQFEWLDEETKKEIRQSVKDSIPDLDEQTINNLLQSAEKFFLVEKENDFYKDDSTRIVSFNKNSWEAGGKTAKFSNIFLDLDKLVYKGAEVSLLIIGALHNPYIVPLTALIVLENLKSLAEVQINEKHAVVLWVMGKSGGFEKSLDENSILNAANEELKAHGKKEIGTSELREILNDLMKLKCVERIGSSRYRLRERVKIDG